MIGNDVVDLSVAASESNWQRPGFLEKQFTQKEQEYILKACNPFLQVWVFWSMKEAAYKCYTQQHKKRFFAPQKFECTIISQTKGTVSFKGNTFYTRTTTNVKYCYTVANNQPISSSFFTAIGVPNIVNEDLKKALQNATGYLAETITKRSSVVGAPSFYYKEELLTKSCSITHHGCYGAYAFTLQNEF